MVIGSVYFSMLMTNWAAYDITEKTFARQAASETSMWIKLFAGWLTALLYIWTLVVSWCYAEGQYEGDAHGYPQMEQSYH